MSEENVEVVRRSYEVFNRGSVDAVIGRGFWSPEIVLDASSTGIPGLGVYRGYDEVKAVLDEDWFQAFPLGEWEIEVGELIDAGDQVFAMSHQRGRGASSGVGAELALANIFTLRDGVIVRVDLYSDRAKALEAAGLEE